MTSQKNKILLKDYQAPDFHIIETNLEFQIFDEHTIVTNSMLMSGPLDKKITLDGIDLKLIDISIDHKILPANSYTIENETLTILNLANWATPQPNDQSQKQDRNSNSSFTITIRTEIYPHLNTSLEGLYKSGSGFCTQCEAQGFRKISYYLDRPDVMSKFTCTIEADQTKYPTLLSNGNLIQSSVTQNGRHKVIWQDPFVKPCYLFALVAGNYSCVKDTFKTQSNKIVQLELFCAFGKEDRAHHAIESLKKSMKWDEINYGREYDLDCYMILAVDDFNAGAMENKGLNIFNTKYVFADSESATDTDYENIEAVIAHEYFHNWTGNRITLRDWFHLSLKEGLTVFRDQQFTEDQTASDVKRIDDVQNLRWSQFSEDAGPNAHPVRPESCLAVDNFFSTTIYEKGAEVIRMIHTIVGKENFRKSMDLYFEKFDGQAVTIEDFVQCFEKTANIDLTHFKKWYNQSGTPEITATEHFDATKNTYTLELTQNTRPTLNQKEKENLFIPIRIAFFYENGEKLNLKSQLNSSNSHLSIYDNNPTEGLLILKEKNQKLILTNLKAKPIASLVRNFSSPVHLFGCDAVEQLSFLAQNDDDGFNKWDSIQKLYIHELKKNYNNVGISKMNSEALSSDLHLVLKKLMNQLVQHIESKNSTKNIFGIASRLLNLPSCDYFIQLLTEFNPESLYQAYFQIYKTIAKSFKSELLTIEKGLSQTSPKDMSFHAISMRSLRNQILQLLGYDETNLPHLFEMFKQAHSMTEQWGALTSLNIFKSEYRSQAGALFKNKWKDDILVVNKYLAWESQLNHKDTIESIQAIMKEDFFKIKNPNNARSLLGTFSTENILGYHRVDGLGYQWIGDQIISIDAFNPQTAARISTCFEHYGKLEPVRKKLMQSVLEKIIKTPNLSKNTFELLKNTLEV